MKTTPAVCRTTALLRTAMLIASLTGAAVSAQTLTVVMQVGVLRVMDPVLTTANITTYHGYMIYDTLLGLDSDFNVRPQMADWQVSDDGKTYVFTLRKGLRWHDGTPVTSEDCIASIERWSQVDVTGQMLRSMITHFKVLDDKRFEIQLAEPTGLLLEGISQLSTRALFMMPKRIAQTPVTTPITEYVGSGPFKFVASEFKPGQKVVYEKNADYVPRNEPANWTSGGKIVHVDRVEWVSMPDQITAINALANGEVDYLQAIPFDLLSLVQNRDDIKVQILDPLGVWTFFRLNHLNPPFDNKLLRQAALYAVSQEEILQALVGNPAYYQTCAAVLGCGTLYGDSYGEDWVVPGNAAKARELLEQADYDGAPVVILQPTDNALTHPPPTVIGAALRKAGFKVEMKSMDWQSVLAQRESQKPTSEGGWSIFSTFNMLASDGRPFANLSLAAAGRKSWTGWPDIPEMEKLRRAFIRAAEPSERKTIAAKMQRLAIDEVAVVPLGQFQIPVAYSTKVSDIIRAPVYVFWNLKKSDD